MGQQEVYNILKQHKTKWLANHKIRDIMDITLRASNISISTKKLARDGFIFRKANPNYYGKTDRTKYLYKWKK